MISKRGIDYLSRVRRHQRSIIDYPIKEIIIHLAKDLVGGIVSNRIRMPAGYNITSHIPDLGALCQKNFHVF